MRINKLIIGDFKTNCYVIEHNHNAIIIDPACKGELIVDFLASKKLKVSTIFLTHGHSDHIGAVDYLYNLYKCKIYAHIKEKDIISRINPAKIADLGIDDVKITSPINYFDGDFQSFNIEGIVIDAILTPGHTEGSTTYVLRNYKRIFSGDTLFKENVGRVDLPTANEDDLMQSLSIYKTFTNDCKVHPGHGDSTTIEHELNHNMYLR